MGRAALAVLAAFFVAAAPAAAAPYTTVERTIQDCDGDQLLEFAPGEPHTDGTRGGGEGCQPDRTGTQPFRLPPSASLLHFLQMTDFQIIDEESPGRVEFLDPTQRTGFFDPFSAAYRPQDSLTTQITEASSRQARNTTSPVTGAQLDFTLLTGDNADSQQFNETRWFIDILDGTTGGAPPDPEMHPDDTRDHKIDPNSGIPGEPPNCDANATIYDGVRNSGTSAAPDFGYYEPDSSTEPRDDGDGYSPILADNFQQTPFRQVRVRDFPGLFERANRPFEALGLGMPWYSAFGNHDALVQGNSPDAYLGPGGIFNPEDLFPGAESREEFNPVFHEIATGCVKVKQPTPAQLQDLLAADSPSEVQAIANEVLADAEEDPDQFVEDGGQLMFVPPDKRRCYLAKDDPARSAPDSPCTTGSWIGQHFRTTGTPVGHGFAPSSPAFCERYGAQQDECEQEAQKNAADAQAAVGRPPSAIENHDGYYSFIPKPGFRFIAIDTITDECNAEVCAEGSIDDEQFEWLRDQLMLASNRGERVIAFAHHTLATIRQPNTDLTEQPVHYGQRFDRRTPGNPQQPSPPPLETLEDLFCQRRNVIAFVTGHEHENFVEEHRCTPDGGTIGGPGHFYEISTAAHLDYPQQARMIELVQTPAGPQLVLTMLDHAGPAYPGNSQAGFETGAAGEDVLRLASIGREIAYNDYQGKRTARGSREDRNVILPLAIGQ